MIRPSKTLAALILAAAFPVHADECVRLVVPEGKVITVSASVTQSTHLTLPEPIRKDVVGVPELWDSHHAAAVPEHYWIRPKNIDEPLAGNTSLTLLTPSRSYDFILERVENPRSTCYVIDEDIPLGSGVVAPIETAAPAGAAPAAWFTRYQWKGSQIESVYDDGRFTYVRLVPRPLGEEVPIIQGGSKRKPLLIDSSYDAQTRTYRVSGIHNELTLVDGREAIRIRRQS